MIKNDGCINVYIKCRSLELSHEVFLVERRVKKKRKKEGLYLLHMQTITILIITTKYKMK